MGSNLVLHSEGPGLRLCLKELMRDSSVPKAWRAEEDNTDLSRSVCSPAVVTLLVVLQSVTGGALSAPPSLGLHELALPEAHGAEL